MAWLAVTAGPLKGQSYQLKVGDNTIGRGTENDLVIEDGSVSRQHAAVKVQDNEFILVDLGSRGGTKVAGKTLEGKPLASGGVVGVGKTELRLVEVEAGQPSAQPVSASGETMIQEPGGGGGGGVLIAQSGPDSGKSFTLAQGDNLIGREPGIAVLLADDTVSRRHALIRYEQGRHIVFDLGSRTGTRVDQERIGGHRLTPSETITLGTTEIVLMLVETKEG